MQLTDILDILNDEYEHLKERFGELIVKIVLAYQKEHPGIDLLDVINALDNVGKPPDEKSLFSTLCNGLDAELKLPNTPPGVALIGSTFSRFQTIDAVVSLERVKVGRIRNAAPILHFMPLVRTVESIRRGRRLARAAPSLQGWFNWVPRWGSEVAPLRNFRGQGDAPGMQCFSMWANGLGPQPSPLTSMNCWESVLLCAFEAGLLTQGQIRGGYGAAMQAARIILEPHLLSIHRAESSQALVPFSQHIASAFDRFVDILGRQLLQSGQTWPVNIAAGLIPRAGDLIFVNGGPQGHVAISLGRTWVGGIPRDRVFSLWTHNGGHFDVIDLGTLQLLGTLSFRPCPF